MEIREGAIGGDIEYGESGTNETPFATPGASPTTMATNEAGTLLYVNNNNGAVSVFTIAVDGKLTLVPGSPFFRGLPAVTGMAVFPSKNCSQN